jgi:DNA-binding NtrC family response regulator
MEDREAKKILAVDDETDTVEIITTLLQLDGYQVLPAPSADDAMGVLEVDVRVIDGTNKNLTDEMRKGTFREDLYYRLNLIPISVPPLHERKDDIPILASHFLKKLSHERGKEVTSFSSEVKEILLAHVTPQLRSEILFSESGWSLRRKLQAAPL